MALIRRALVVLLCSALVTLAQGNSFDRVRYNGGAIATKVSPKEWHNKLTITSDIITFELKDGQRIEINPKNVTSLSYGQEAHRRVGTMIALGILVSPLALFGLLHKTRLHFIGIQFETADAKPSAVLLQGDKDNYRAILVALSGVTGKPVATATEDRQYVPTGIPVAAAPGPSNQ